MVFVLLLAPRIPLPALLSFKDTDEYFWEETFAVMLMFTGILIDWCVYLKEDMFIWVGAF